MKSYSSLLLIFLLQTFSLVAQKVAEKSYTQYVNPFIGTGGHGHTYPGAVLPHGMVQLSPDTRLDGWDGCSGYHFSDSYIYGFSHTHLSGTGVSDYGDVLLMPMSRNPSPDNKVYGATFSKKNEKASPGFYGVFLNDDSISVELTATERVGMHRYRYGAGKKQLVILDLLHRDEVLESSLKLEDSITVSGLRRSKAWAVDQYVYFVMKFSTPIKNFGIYENDKLIGKSIRKVNNSKNIKAWFEFADKKNTVLIKVAISQVDVEGARKNLKAELPGWDFNAVKKQANDKWNKALKVIEVKSNDISRLTTFYTSLYHTMVVPSLADDVDGRYRGRDLKIHQSKGGDIYTVFSLWDTHRATHPLYAIIDRKRTLDYIKTFLLQYQQGGRLPVWELSSNETDCMIGYHSVSVIVDAFFKGIDGFDKELALEAMKKSATWNHLGLPAYIKKGLIETGDDNESVSKTLEYAYDDWCIAQFARALGKKEDYANYIQRAQYYKNVFDPQTQNMRPRKNGDWLSPFDPREVNNYYTEANSWQYSFSVQQDIDGFASLLGGRKNLEKKLDDLFSSSSETTGRIQSDITGLIGQYAHGNEPSHHIIYLYNFAGAPHKTQEKVHQVLTQLYHDQPDGLSGNEDCGQMSAWYVLSALGFYPVTPGSDQYIIGTPLFSEATIHLENGKSFVIKANNISENNFYIQSATLNGKAYSKSFFSHTDLENGGIFIFEMGDKPGGFGTKDFPSIGISDQLIVRNPVIKGGNEMSFYRHKTIEITSPDTGTKIYFTLDGSEPKTDTGQLYTHPILLYNEGDEEIVIKAIAVDERNKSSKVTTSILRSRSNNYRMTLVSPYEQEYDGGGNEALVDGITATTNWRMGHWQGFREDMNVTVDLNELKPVTSVTTRFLQESKSWIIMPSEVTVEISEDGITFNQVFNGNNFIPIENMTPTIVPVEAKFPETKVRYIRIKARQYGKMPSWYEEGGGGLSHIFADEIIIR